MHRNTNTDAGLVRSSQTKLIPGPKILFFDIESTNLNAPFGTILCIGYKFLDDPKIHVPTIMDSHSKGMLDDRGLVERFAKIWDWADYCCGHYAQRFDLPMIQSKLIKYDLPPLSPKVLIDTWRVARDNLKMHSNRLGAIAEYLGCKTSKSPITFDDWLRAAHGDKKSLKYIVEHCRLDVLVLEEVFLKLRPLIKKEPARQLFITTDAVKEQEVCIACGSDRVTRQGFRVSRTRKYQQLKCQDCGKWMQATHSSGQTLTVG